MKIKQTIQDLYQKYHSDLEGEVSDAFPVLRNVDPDVFAISVATVEGDVFHVGAADEQFTIQSISKPIAYALALEQHGSEFLESKVGMEPTGEDYDSVIKLDDQGRPYNPMVNSGAVVTTSSILQRSQDDREQELLQYFSRFAGRKLEVDHQTYESEYKNAHKNWAIAHLLRHFKVLGKSFKQDLDLYFKQCSIEITVDDLAMIGATFANRGVNPKTREECLSHENLRHVLSILLTCGMYNYSGEWVFDVGLPAKSGISGSILMIVPGVMGIAVYSPRLDKRGNSVRGIKVCEELSHINKIHLLDYECPSSVSEVL